METVDSIIADLRRGGFCVHLYPNSEPVMVACGMNNAWNFSQGVDILDALMNLRKEIGKS